MEKPELKMYFLKLDRRISQQYKILFLYETVVWQDIIEILYYIISDTEYFAMFWHSLYLVREGSIEKICYHVEDFWEGIFVTP